VAQGPVGVLVEQALHTERAPRLRMQPSATVYARASLTASTPGTFVLRDSARRLPVAQSSVSGERRKVSSSTRSARSSSNPWIDLEIDAKPLEGGAHAAHPAPGRPRLHDRNGFG
jgi:hypothetical protein